MPIFSSKVSRAQDIDHRLMGLAIPLPSSQDVAQNVRDRRFQVLGAQAPAVRMRRRILNCPAGDVVSVTSTVPCGLGWRKDSTCFIMDEALEQ